MQRITRESGCFNPLDETIVHSYGFAASPPKNIPMRHCSRRNPGGPAVLKQKKAKELNSLAPSDETEFLDYAAKVRTVVSAARCATAGQHGTGNR